MCCDPGCLRARQWEAWGWGARHLPRPTLQAHLCVKLPLALPHSFLPAPCLDLVPSWQTVGSGEAPTGLVSLRSGPLNEGGQDRAFNPTP